MSNLQRVQSYPIVGSLEHISLFSITKKVRVSIFQHYVNEMPHLLPDQSWIHGSTAISKRVIQCSRWKAFKVTPVYGTVSFASMTAVFLPMFPYSFLSLFPMFPYGSKKWGNKGRKCNTLTPMYIKCQHNLPNKPGDIFRMLAILCCTSAHCGHTFSSRQTSLASPEHMPGLKCNGS